MADEIAVEPAGEVVAPEQPRRDSVPLSALLGEREKFQGREAELRATIDELSSNLRSVQSQVERKVSEAPVDEQSKARKEWSAFLGLDKLEERLSKFDAAIGRLDELAAKIPSVEHGSNLAFSNYARGVEMYVGQQYDARTMPVTPAAWQKMVAGEMTDRETSDIANGDTEVLNKVIARAKKDFTASGQAGRTREAQHVRGLPRTPGAGGVSPSSGGNEKPFTSLRDLHKQAGEDFLSIKERERG